MATASAFWVAAQANIDSADLEQRFRALSRQFHPTTSTTRHRRAAGGLERSSYLNDAYRRAAADCAVSISTSSRARAKADEAGEQVPALLEEVFALNEELDEVRERRASTHRPRMEGRLERARVRSRPSACARRTGDALSVQWDALVDRGRGSRRQITKRCGSGVLERNYISNLLAGIERELNA